MSHWTLAAAVRLDAGAAGAIVSICEDGEDAPVRGLAVHDSMLKLIGWSWRGGLCMWSTQVRFAVRRWAHVAASLGPEGDLLLYQDGQLARAWHVRELFPGRGPQTINVGGEVIFTDRRISGWNGALQGVEYYSGALTSEQIKRLADDALGVAEPEPAPRAPVAPAPAQGCANPAHLPGWRTDEAGDVRCVVCCPSRGCQFDEHQRYWRPAAGSDVYRHDLKFECGLCLAAAGRLAVAQTA